MAQQQGAQIIEFPRSRRVQRDVPVVVDYESWYHAEEIRKDQSKLS
jgi:hypothetical protein